MCQHQPQCPPVVVFDDLGELLPLGLTAVALAA